MSIALLIIDMQKEFIQDEKFKQSVVDSLEYINETADIFRKAGKPVIIIQDEEAGEGPDSIPYEVMDEIVTNEEDYYISKMYSNSFWKTGLEELLKELKVEFLVISGFAAEHCVLFTYNGALERGYGASMLQHGIAGLDPKRVQDTQLVRAVVSIEALYFFLNKK